MKISSNGREIEFEFYDTVSNKTTIREDIPTVPPNSMTQTSAGPSFPSTGIIDTDSIQFFIASVICGTTYIFTYNARKE